MGQQRSYILGILVVLCGIGYYTAQAAYSSITGTTAAALAQQNRVDSSKTELRYPVAKTGIEEYNDLLFSSPADLKNPENLKSNIEYDAASNSYVFRTQVGDMEVNTPFMLNANEYNELTLQQSINTYYRQKNAESFSKGNNEFNFMDMQFALGPLDKVFGPGGVRVKTQGSAELSLGLKTNNVQNPALPLRARKKTYFDFDEKIQATINASVGDKMKFNMNYNTDATFDFDAQKLKLQYEGKEDEIIKNIEAGNVSMTTGSSLIRGGAALFGIKTTLQFGKLTATALLSQQESESKTINTKGGAQTTEFEVTADQYDENRHFFLAHFFRDNYDRFVAKLPYISSGVKINRVEVWVTNRRANYDRSRNVLALMDLGEKEKIGNNHWVSSVSYSNPSNSSNNLYSTLREEYPDARNINLVTQVLAPLASVGFEGGRDYVKVESARKLEITEYTLNDQLGYISLKSMLQPDEVLSVAYEYTLNGNKFQVGEFSSDITDTNASLFLKMLKGTTINTRLPIWHLMMKNIYSLNAYQVQKERFKLDIKYLSDTTGVFLNYLPVGNIKNEILLRVLNLDRLDANLEPNPNGLFDFVEGYTILPQNGKIIFPVVEPFGSYLAKKIGNASIAKQYVFQELYDSTLTVARQMSEKNKFLLKGEYKSSSGAEISLGAMNVPRGSVRVTAGGMTLVENSDYSVDYSMGMVTILNQSIIESGTPISVSLENQSTFSMQRKTMVGLDLNYKFSKNFTLGGTIMHLSEKALTQKINFGDEVLNNTLWGLNTAYNAEFQWLTNWVDKLPLIVATAPSKLSLTAEFAQLVPGQPGDKNENGISYLDDFESSQLGIDIRTPYSWMLASTPSPFLYDGKEIFTESRLSNDTRYGENRALLSWYYIDRMFTQRNSSLTPAHIKGDLNQLSNHYVREIDSREIYPNKELGYGESNSLQVLNLSYYPTDRGPYNLDATRIDTDGQLLNPEDRWGGMMRKMDNTDFEASNIEQMEFWLLDPFIYDKEGNVEGGDLFFNFGEISEDILKDGMKSFENGLPINGDTSHLATTTWGKVSKRQSMVYAFENADGARKKQDVGLDGLANNEEFTFNTYQNFLTKLLQKISPQAQAQMAQDPFSPINDPAGDNYHFYRGVDYDNLELDILSRYRHYNNVEGNSSSPEEANDQYYQSSRSVPDVEDINQDNTLNEYERYYQYRISIRPKDLVVGKNFITDKRVTTVKLRNGNEEEVTWYQFKVPLTQYESKIGAIQDFKTIRFSRVFLTGFKKETHLRFASLELVRGEWRSYTQPLYNPATPPISDGTLDVSVVNIEENAGQLPVNYVLPPGITRVIDPGQSQITQLNEQAMSLKITNLAPSDARGVYKNTRFDMRQFKRLQMYTHAEKLIDDVTDLKNGDLAVFIRIGSDNRSNYYEYEVPLELTPADRYNTYNYQDQQAVWPAQNMINVALSLFTDLKLKRNTEKRKGGNITFQTPYSIYDPENIKNKATIVGNPSLSDIRSILIGVRNSKGRSPKSAVVWINELRLTDFNQDGGWAARANANLAISDLATINVSGITETSGFGGVDQSLTQRRLDDFYQINLATQIDLGRLLPEKAKLKAPLFYSISEQTTSPKYNPLDQDILLSDALDAVSTSAERDSIRDFSQDKTTIESISLSGIKVDIQSKSPMPWDPANFTASYSFNRQSKKNPSTTFENTYDYRGNLSYSYSPFVKPFEPFKSIKSKSKHLTIIKDISINYLPQNISLFTNISRQYYELKLRDFNDPTSSNELPMSISKNFLWDRQFAIQWNITKAIQLSLNTMTNSRIDEPQGAVNKAIFPDEYEVWKDTVRQSILNLGTPWNYSQTFNAAYNVPLNKIPVLDFASLTIKYNANYGWDRGVIIDPEIIMGNSINNQGQMSVESRLNLETLYNKLDFLKKTNQKFSAQKSNTTQDKNKPKKKFAQKITLKKDTTVTIKHNLDNKRLMVTAKNKDIAYPIKYRIVDKNSIIIETRDSIPVDLDIVQGLRIEEETWYQIAQHGARFGMSVRNINIRFKRGNNMMVPSFLPTVGNAFGQNYSDNVMAPGLGFAFGFTDESYLQTMIDRNWLIIDEALINPAITNSNQEFQIDASLEPIRGLKIALSAIHSKNNNKQTQFMFDGMPSVQGGNFAMSHIAIKTSLRNSNPSNGYASEAFNDFLYNRQIIANRINQQYGIASPANVPMDNLSASGNFDSSIRNEVKLSSPDVMIPAFIAAYTGKSASKIGLTAFPSLSSILPNWRITYDGLMQIPYLRRNLKSATINHSYKCNYAVGAYNSYLNWMEASDGLGYVRDELSGYLLPSSPFDITSVSITEGFLPLLGIDVTFKNNITTRLEYKNSRNLSLNMGAGQIVEALSDDITIGVGYKIVNLKALLKMRSTTQGFNNDLTLRADFSFKEMQSLIRRIEQDFTQATNGTRSLMIKCSADYTLSKLITVRAFYDKQINTPLVSSTAYPTSNSNFGVAIRVSLTR